ncbi:hypothetical protein V5O48_017786, partial [Marasmius crinis-equi]
GLLSSCRPRANNEDLDAATFGVIVLFVSRKQERDCDGMGRVKPQASASSSSSGHGNMESGIAVSVAGDLKLISGRLWGMDDSRSLGPTGI